MAHSGFLSTVFLRELYACPIIKAAVKGGNLAKEVQPDLVAAALEAAPDQAPEIKACEAMTAAALESPTSA